MYSFIILWFLLLAAIIGLCLYKKWFIGAIASGVLFFLSIFATIFFQPYAFVENYELGYKFDARDGQITVLDRPGYHWRTPIFEAIHTIDMRPRQVCINVGYGSSGTNSSVSADSPNRRVLNCKLVQFDRNGLSLFLEWHGRGDYTGDALDDLLKIYAYDGTGKAYPFLRVLRELRSNEEALPNNALPVQQ